MGMTDKINEKLETSNQSQTSENNTNVDNNEVKTNPEVNTDGKLKLKVVINGKEELREFTHEELAQKVQLAEVSTQRFQESSILGKKASEELKKAQELYNKLSMNSEQAPKPQEEHTNTKIKEDYPDEYLTELNALKAEISNLRQEQNSVFKTVVEKERNEKISNVVNKYGVDKNFIDTEVLPYMASNGVDDLETAIKAVLFEKGKTKQSTVTRDGNGVNIQNPKSVEDSVIDSIFSHSNIGITAKLNNRGK